MAKLELLIQQFRSELGADFVSTDVVGMDGLSIAGGSIDPNFNSTDASARFSMVMKLAAKVSGKLGLGKVDDNLVTTDKAYIIARFLGDGSYYWGVAVTRNATLGTVRMMMNEYADQLWDAIPR
jgi:predicted regulator of Ras-like GTPase activity (Roadblock/LC7/MglB family)